VCHHAKRYAIEVACDSASVADVAARYGLSEFSLARHVERHERASGVLACEEQEPATLRSEGVAA